MSSNSITILATFFIRFKTCTSEILLTSIVFVTFCFIVLLL
nr:MAG TPA: hypothetical protein [Caudoviricetes sp.]